VRRRFFVDEFANGTARLLGEAAQHLGRVLRAEPGQLYELSDSHTVHLAKVERVAPEEITFSLISPVEAPESPLRVTLLLAIVKFDRFEWALEKAVELGTECIMPLAAARSEPHLIAAAAKRAERWRRIIRESAQQARCRRLPELLPLVRSVEGFRAGPAGEIRASAIRAGQVTTGQTATDQIATEEIRVLLSEREGAPTLRHVFAAAKLPSLANSSPPIAPPGEAGLPPHSVKISLAVGPEGGWTDSEFAAAAAAGFVEASFGGNILRTETAVAAGLAAAHLYFDV
jgi:16S rRNA (uracil1498-N3)-methyltransferase